jgi:hypothetical protein
LNRHKPGLFIFGWPGWVGGADTKLAHLIPLLCRDFSITVIPNRAELLRQQEWVDYLRRHGATCCSLAELGGKLDGAALAMCNARFFTDGLAAMAKERGLRVFLTDGRVEIGITWLRTRSGRPRWGRTTACSSGRTTPGSGAPCCSRSSRTAGGWGSTRRTT